MNQTEYIIRLEKKEDYREVENLTRDAFWNVYRPGCMEHYVLHSYRDDAAFVPELDFVMEVDGKILLDYSMEKAKALGAGALAIEGNLDFYGKSGFVPAKMRGIRYEEDPDADYFLIKELNEGFLDGVSGIYKDPEEYFVCEKDPEGFAQFEASFPPKEKRKLPGQLF